VLFVLRQGAYNSGKPGKPGKLREFFNSGKLRENSGNFKFTQGIFVSVIVGIEFCALLSVTVALIGWVV